ncbi:MAG: radical SAM protein [Candidatus Omnitrophica bacterium]|nr:radical SAM protein [Candidatus Omnitrophota bacterium]
MKQKFFRYALSVVRNDALLNIGTRVRRCLNTPQVIYFSVTYQCNARCVTCLRWQNEPDPHELSLDECKDIVTQLYRWLGSCYMSFTGGEPFVKNGFLDLLTYANKVRVCTNVSTNGIVFTPDMYDTLLRTGVDSIVFSLNSVRPELHNHYKGDTQLHQRIVSAIRYIRTKNPRPRIGVLCLVTRDTYKELSHFARWATELGVDSVDFQPILGIHPKLPAFSTPLSEKTLALPLARLDHLDALDKEVETLIEMKRKGFPIITPKNNLALIKAFFRNTDLLRTRHACTVGFRNLYISHTGEVQLCPWFPPIGNVRGDSLQTLWFSKTAQRQRIQILECTKPCLAGCMRKYGYAEKLLHFLILNKMAWQHHEHRLAGSPA